MTPDRELLLHDAVETAVSCVHRWIWSESKLTPAEARLAWMRVIQALVGSVVIERQGDVMREMVAAAAERSEKESCRVIIKRREQESLAREPKP